MREGMLHWAESFEFLQINVQEVRCHHSFVVIGLFDLE